MSQAVLSVHISVDYPGATAVLRDVAFDVAEGEIFGLAGESGVGKSTVALAILRLLEMRGGSVRGRILFGGQDLMLLTQREMRKIRGRDIALVLQSPVAAMNPALRIESQFREAWRAHSSVPWREARPEVLSLIGQTGLPDGAGFLSRYPRQVSVGQAQRLVIAMAVLHRPKLIIADEPTSALDPSSRTEVLDLFRRLNRAYKAAILFISHDIDVLHGFCDRAGLLQLGGSVRTANSNCVPTGTVCRHIACHSAIVGAYGLDV
jgi:peptide/nickel transport system ATP-binding protein